MQYVLCLVSEPRDPECKISIDVHVVLQIDRTRRGDLGFQSSVNLTIGSQFERNLQKASPTRTAWFMNINSFELGLLSSIAISATAMLKFETEFV